MAQENSEEQIQDFCVHLPAQRVHLSARLFACSCEGVLDYQQLAVFYGRDLTTPDDVHRRSRPEANPFEEGL